tara:strand:- start:3903 stop:4319 length:417 start_codon:yes stop_codon:yes gene_type:complete
MNLSDLNPLAAIGGKLIDRFLPDPAAAAAAKQELAQMQQNGELAAMANETKLVEIEQTNTSDRWKADMSSDSWLSKNVRPLTLVYILSAYLALAIMDGTGFHIAESYVTLLGQWGMLVMGAYFGGRTLEKLADMRSRK